MLGIICSYLENPTMLDSLFFVLISWVLSIHLDHLHLSNPPKANSPPKGQSSEKSPVKPQDGSYSWEKSLWWIHHGLVGGWTNPDLSIYDIVKLDSLSPFFGLKTTSIFVLLPPRAWFLAMLQLVWISNSFHVTAVMWRFGTKQTNKQISHIVSSKLLCFSILVFSIFGATANSCFWGASRPTVAIRSLDLPG